MERRRKREYTMEKCFMIGFKDISSDSASSGFETMAGSYHITCCISKLYQLSAPSNVLRNLCNHPSEPRWIDGVPTEDHCICLMDPCKFLRRKISAQTYPKLFIIQHVFGAKYQHIIRSQRLPVVPLTLISVSSAGLSHFCLFSNMTSESNLEAPDSDIIIAQVVETHLIWGRFGPLTPSQGHGRDGYWKNYSEYTVYQMALNCIDHGIWWVAQLINRATGASLGVADSLISCT